MEGVVMHFGDNEVDVMTKIRVFLVEVVELVMFAAILLFALNLGLQHLGLILKPWMTALLLSGAALTRIVTALLR